MLWIKLTWDTNIIPKHKAAGGGHYARNDDYRCDLRLELRASTRGCKSASGHILRLMFDLCMDLILYLKNLQILRLGQGGGCIGERKMRVFRSWVMKTKTTSVHMLQNEWAIYRLRKIKKQVEGVGHHWHLDTCT